MSRPGARNLTLYEELEKLEQSITLTLQEIDSNFSKAHRIVTGSILPIVEQYAKHSNDVWQGSKFWKEFFEASANVSLNGVEEPTHDEDATQTETTVTFDTPDAVASEGQQRTDHQDAEESFTIDSPTQVTGVHSTPTLVSSAKKKNTTSEEPRYGAAFRSPSPRKYTGRNPLGAGTRSVQPSTPGGEASHPESSPFRPISNHQTSAVRTNNDPVMHRILDKTYRIQATPHTQRRQPRSKPTPATGTRTAVLPWDDSPDSSPAIAAPQLRSDLFSPARVARTPGVSLLTPARGDKSNRATGAAAAAAAPVTSTGRRLFSPEDKAYAATKDRTSYTFQHDDSDDDDDDDEGWREISPPKTMQFHVPHSRLMQTPAREASKRIVEDLLLTAGADATDEIEGEEEYIEEPSPSVVRKVFDAEDDTF